MTKYKLKYGYTTLSASITLTQLKYIHDYAEIKRRNISESARYIIQKGIDQIEKEIDVDLKRLSNVPFDEEKEKEKKRLPGRKKTGGIK